MADESVIHLLNKRARIMEDKYALWKARYIKGSAKDWKGFLEHFYEGKEEPRYVVYKDKKGTFYMSFVTWIDIFARMKKNRFIDVLAGIDGFILEDSSKLLFSKDRKIQKGDFIFSKDDIEAILVFGKSERLDPNRQAEDLSEEINIETSNASS